MRISAPPSAGNKKMKSEKRPVAGPKRNPAEEWLTQRLRAGAPAHASCKWIGNAAAFAAEKDMIPFQWSPTAVRPWHLSTRFVGRNPPKRTLLAYSAEAAASAAKAGRQGYGGYPPRIHPRVYTRGFLRRRVNARGYGHRSYRRWRLGHRPGRQRGT